MRFAVIIAVGLVLAACSNVAGKPLALVDAKDPIWALPLDHVDAAELPR